MTQKISGLILNLEDELSNLGESFNLEESSFNLEESSLDTDESMITINVGGKVMVVELQDLYVSPVLKAMLSGRYRIPKLNGIPFTDRDPDVFARVYNYMKFYNEKWRKKYSFDLEFCYYMEKVFRPDDENHFKKHICDMLDELCIPITSACNVFYSEYIKVICL